MATPPRPVSLQIDDVGTITLVRFNCRVLVDTALIQPISDHLVSLVRDCQRTRMVLNFKHVEMVATTMVACLIDLFRRIQLANGQLAVCEIGPTIYEVLDILHITRLLNIYRGEKEALEAVKNPA